jgi:poly(3-hydroxybutyrate) depolymerase
MSSTDAGRMIGRVFDPAQRADFRGSLSGRGSVFLDNAIGDAPDVLGETRRKDRRGGARMRCLCLLLLALTIAVGSGATASGANGTLSRRSAVRVWTITYRAHDGPKRRAYVVLPAWYGPKRHPSIPLIISPHGRGTSGLVNARIWAELPALGGFAVVNPAGQGRRVERYSWGYAGQIKDLARMPRILSRTLPWLRIDPRRIFAFGGSMGGQESLLLAAEHPRLLAGAAAFDAVADLALQYRNFPKLQCNRACLRQWVDPIGVGLQAIARIEVGGSPATNPAGYARRSPLAYAHKLAFGGVSLQLWWSAADRVVINQPAQSARLFWKIKTLNRRAPIEAFIGRWAHSAEMRANSRLPLALATFGLLPARYRHRPAALHLVPPPTRELAMETHATPLEAQ